METVYDDVRSKSLVDDCVAKDVVDGSAQWTDLACVVENSWPNTHIIESMLACFL